MSTSTDISFFMPITYLHPDFKRTGLSFDIRIVNILLSGIRMNDKIQKRLNDIPTAYKNNYKKAMAGKNRAAGVKSFCLECMGWQRVEVKNCESVACPLYPYKPYK